MVANNSDVNFGFGFGAKLPDPQNLLVGTGINKRHMKFRSLEELDVAYCGQVLGEAVALAER